MNFDLDSIKQSFIDFYEGLKQKTSIFIAIAKAYFQSLDKWEIVGWSFQGVGFILLLSAAFV